MPISMPAALKRSQRRRRRGEMGFTLIETLLAIGIGAIMLTMFAYAAQERSWDIRDKNAADQLRTYQQAVDAYVRDNWASFVAASPLTINPAVNPWGGSALNAYLPAGWGTNSYGMSYAAMSRPIVRGGKTVGAEVLLVAGGNTQPVDAKRLPSIAALSGSVGAVFPTALTAQGTYGGWTENLAGFGTGAAGAQAAAAAAGVSSLQIGALLYQDNNQILGDYLYRNLVPGHPEANQMNTNIDMNGSGINNANTINLGSDNNAGAPCTNTLTGLADNSCGLQFAGGEAGFYNSANGWLYFRGTAAGGFSIGDPTTPKNLSVSGDTNVTGNLSASDLYLTNYGQWMSKMLSWSIDSSWFAEGDGATVPIPTCPNGASAKIFVIPQQQTQAITVKPQPWPGSWQTGEGIMRVKAHVLDATHWMVDIKFYDTSSMFSASCDADGWCSDPNGKAIALTYCYKAPPASPTVPAAAPTYP